MMIDGWQFNAELYFDQSNIWDSGLSSEKLFMILGPDTCQNLVNTEKKLSSCATGHS